jgi:hypothetical protein
MMSPIRREVLNGLFVLVISTLLSAAIAAFEIKFNLQLWVLIVMAVAIAVGGYVVFEFVMSNEEELKKTEQRELEWLKRVGTPARMELNREGEATSVFALNEAANAMSPGSDITVLLYVGSEPHRREATTIRNRSFGVLVEMAKNGRFREYKRIICFDHHVLANDPELKSGVLRVGEGPGTIDRGMGEHCRAMLQTKGCSLYVAPALLRFSVIMFGVDKVSISVETSDPNSGGRTAVGIIFFSDPPNGEIVEQFRQMERETERHMVAVHTIRFPEDAEPRAELANR